MKLAITHQVSHRINECEVNFRDREPIDLALARRQHEGYCDWLRGIGVEVVKVDVNPDHPDSVFVEDTAVVVDEAAVMTTMGVASRRGEVAGMEKVLAQYRPIKRIAEMGFGGASLEGGDVLRVGRDFFVGLTTRSNLAGARALEAALKPFGYSVTPVPVSSGLHLKSAASALDEETLLVHLPALDPGPLKRLPLHQRPGGGAPGGQRPGGGRQHGHLLGLWENQGPFGAGGLRPRPHRHLGADQGRFRADLLLHRHELDK